MKYFCYLAPADELYPKQNLNSKVVSFLYNISKTHSLRCAGIYPTTGPAGSQLLQAIYILGLSAQYKRIAEDCCNAGKRFPFR